MCITFRFLCPSKENLKELTHSLRLLVLLTAITMPHCGAIRWFAQNRKCSLRGDLVIPRNPRKNWILFKLKLKLTIFALIGRKGEKTILTRTRFSPIFLIFLFVHSKSSFRYNWARCLQDIKSCPTIQYAITPPMLQIKDRKSSSAIGSANLTI